MHEIDCHRSSEDVLHHMVGHYLIALIVLAALWVHRAIWKMLGI